MIRVLCLVAVIILATAAPAAAHNVTVGADLRIAQTIAGAEVTVVIKGTSRVPGPLRIGVVAYQPVTDLPVGLEVRSLEDGHKVTGTARAARDPQYAQLRVERTGPHELKLSAGNEVSVIPFRVLVDRGSAGDFLIYGGLFVAGLLMVGGLLTGAMARRTTAMALAAGAAAGVTVAAMVIVFEPQLPPAAPDGAAPTAATPLGGRPYVQARVATVPARPAAGEDFTFRIDLVDGSTGRPVDDLIAHHEALAHVVVTSQDGRYFRHVHPLRTAPGRLEVRLRADRPGQYLTHTELEREDSGSQLTAAPFTVGGEPTTATTTSPDKSTLDKSTLDKSTLDKSTLDKSTLDTPTPDTPTPDTPTPDTTVPDTTVPDTTVPDVAALDAPTPDTTALDAKIPDSTGAPAAEADGGGQAVVPRVQPAVPVAGRPATIEVAAPSDVRPWLGMAGHLIIRSQDGTFFGHVHEMGTPGSRLRFTFSFPEAGRYLAWAQYATGDRIVTAPFTVDVTGSENSP